MGFARVRTPAALVGATLLLLASTGCTDQRKEFVDTDIDVDVDQLSTCEDRIEAVAQQLAAEELDPPELGDPAMYRALWRETVEEKRAQASFRVSVDYDDCGPQIGLDP